MPAVTFQVIEGIDKGRIFRNLQMPVTVGREEGNLIRLNDERVSRYHAKVQHDNGEIILTDLESTNGTRVNGLAVQIRRLRPGDRVEVGRSLLLFGSEEEIAARIATLKSTHAASGDLTEMPATIAQATALAAALESDLDFILDPQDPITVRSGYLFAGNHPLPPLPLRLTPAQAARLSELLDFLHRQLSQATENIKANEEGDEVTLTFVSWQRVLALQAVLARYVRAVAEPEAMAE